MSIAWLSDHDNKILNNNVVNVLCLPKSWLVEIKDERYKDLVEMVEDFNLCGWELIDANKVLWYQQHFKNILEKINEKPKPNN